MKHSILRQRLFAVQNGECFYCERRMTLRLFQSVTITVDHRVPVSRGGGRGQNIVGACQRCNHFKADLTEAEFRGKYGAALERLPEYKPGMPGGRLERKEKRKQRRARVKALLKECERSVPKHRPGHDPVAMGYDKAATFSLREVWPDDELETMC